MLTMTRLVVVIAHVHVRKHLHVHQKSIGMEYRHGALIVYDRYIII